MDLQLLNKLAVVTGSTGEGIGYAIALELAKQGAYVVINGRSDLSVQASVQSMLKELNDHQKNGKDVQMRVFGVVGNIGTMEGVKHFIVNVNKVEKELNTPVEILVNNVGIFHSQDYFELSDEKWMDYYNINVMSGERLSRHYLKEMLKDERRASHGRILFISSEAGVRALPNMIPYSVSKASQITLARGLSELTKGADCNVTVNSVLPGPTMTGGVKAYMKQFAEQKNIDSLDNAMKIYFQEFEPTSLHQRFLEPSEFANVVAFLCSPLASGINSCAQRVEGGIIRHI